MFILIQKQKRLKGVLKDFDKVHFSRLAQNISSLKEELDVIQHTILNGDLMESTAANERSILIQLETLEATYSSMLRQKARIDWLKFGDASTGFFHAAIRERKAKNAIKAIYNAHGELLQ